MFLHRIEATPNNIAYRFPDDNDNWQQYTWQETGDKVREITGGLCALGLDPEQRCAILSNTRVEWILIDLGILCAGGATTTIYPSSSPEESQYIIHDSGTVFIFAEDASQVEKVLSQRDNLPNLQKIINMDVKDSKSYTDDGFVVNMKELVEMGNEWNKANPDGFVERINNQKLEHLATLIYTSGTTGTPKGVELSSRLLGI